MTAGKLTRQTQTYGDDAEKGFFYGFRISPSALRQTQGQCACRTARIIL
jgi:hypothetical protein